MVKIPVALFGLVATAVHAYPILDKRIAQSITASTAKWEQSCVRKAIIYFVMVYSPFTCPKKKTSSLPEEVNAAIQFPLPPSPLSLLLLGLVNSKMLPTT